jgi:nucleoside-diphosphate-sugar epimerase
MTKILVTGATGFVATHLIMALLDKGYEVRDTAHDTDKADQLNTILSDYAGRPIAIELVCADLNSDAGWAEAMDGISYVQHVASPFPATELANADELIRPERDGALRVLKAAKAAGVKRVVLTSSVAAVDVGWCENIPAAFDKSHWTRMEKPEYVSYYAQSKTLAEQAAWDYVRGEGAGLELAVINPVGVLGPAMSKDVSTSLSTVVAPMRRAMPAYPKLHQGIVDLRDVAKGDDAPRSRRGALYRLGRNPVVQRDRRYFVRGLSRPENAKKRIADLAGQTDGAAQPGTETHIAQSCASPGVQQCQGEGDARYRFHPGARGFARKHCLCG